MVELVVRGATVVDGTGAPGRRADVAVHGGKVVALGLVDEQGEREIDAGGLVVTPGFIDLHTHYDAQLLWDPTASPSPHHGVTTVLGGNCGFSIAPLAPEHVDYVKRMMARVEGIPLEALDAGPAWDWRSFGEWLDRLEGNVVVNAGFLVGHSTMRRVVMGDDAVGGVATPEQIAAMVALAHEAMASGALGVSSSLGEAHTDGDGNPVPSRAGRPEEFLALAAAVREHPGTTLEFIAAMGEIPQERIELMTNMSLAANRPLNWNLLGSLSPTEVYEQQLSSCDWARQHGAHVVALALPDVMRMRSNRMLQAMPVWSDLVALPPEQRRAAAADPERRRALRAAVDEAARGPLAGYTRFDLVEVAEATSPATAPLVGRTLTDIAASRGGDAVDVLLDEVVPNDLPLTLVFPSLVPSLGASEEGWRRRVAVWQDDRVVLGGSDAGAHLDLMCHANYPTVVLGDVVRERGLLPFEAAVRLMTEVPARLYGLTGRGRVEVGAHADLVLLDPEQVGSEPAETRHDLPGGATRLFARSRGVEHVLVGGREVVTAGVVHDTRAGTVLRSGRDTETVTVPGGGR